MSGLTAHDAVLAGEQREEVSCELWQLLWCSWGKKASTSPSPLFPVNLCQPPLLPPDCRAFKEKQLIIFIINLSGPLRPISAARALTQLQKWKEVGWKEKSVRTGRQVYKKGVASSRMFLDVFCGDLVACSGFCMVLAYIVQKTKRCPVVKIEYGYPDRNF